VEECQIPGKLVDKMLRYMVTVHVDTPVGRIYGFVVSLPRRVIENPFEASYSEVVALAQEQVTCRRMQFRRALEDSVPKFRQRGLTIDEKLGVGYAVQGDTSGAEGVLQKLLLHQPCVPARSYHGAALRMKEVDEVVAGGTDPSPVLLDTALEKEDRSELVPLSSVLPSYLADLIEEDSEKEARPFWPLAGGVLDHLGSCGAVRNEWEMVQTTSGGACAWRGVLRESRVLGWHFRGGHLSSRADEWERLGCPSEVLQTIQGDPFPVWNDLAPAYFDNHPSLDEYIDLVRTDVARGLELGMVRLWDVSKEGPPVVLGGLSVVESGSANKLRVIYNGAYASYVEVRRPTPMMDLQCFLKKVRGVVEGHAGWGVWGGVLDLKDGYKQCPLDEPAQTRACFMMDGVLLTHLVLPFGLGSSVPRFTGATTWSFDYAMSEANRKLKNDGVPAELVGGVYVDDGIFAMVAENMRAAGVAFCMLLLEILRLGWVVNGKKIQFGKDIVALGLGVDFENMCVYIPAEKVEMTRALVVELTKRARGGKAVGARALARVFGKLQCLGTVATWVQPMLRTIMAGSLREAMCENMWWKSYTLQEAHIETLDALSLTLFDCPPQPVIFRSTWTIASDASGFAGGAVAWETGRKRATQLASLFDFPSCVGEWHSTWKELLALVLLFAHAARHFQAGVAVMLQTDCTAVISAVLSGVEDGDSPRHALVSLFWAVVREYGFVIRIVHVPGVCNVVPDYLSRCKGLAGAAWCAGCGLGEVPCAGKGERLSQSPGYPDKLQQGWQEVLQMVTGGIARGFWSVSRAAAWRTDVVCHDLSDGLGYCWQGICEC
jgi:hypothetical protein